MLKREMHVSEPRLSNALLLANFTGDPWKTYGFGVKRFIDDYS